MTLHKKALFIFHRDLRLMDNHGLLLALREAKIVIPCFIFDNRQVTNKNPYKSNNALQFMIESLQGLDAQLHRHGSRLYLFSGITETIVEKLIKKEEIDAIYCNRDYTPFALNRDQAIKKIALANGISFSNSPDALLHEPEEVKTGNNDPYSIFTAFYKKASKLPVTKPQKKIVGNFYTSAIKGKESPAIYAKILPLYNKDIAIQGGSIEGLALLKQLKNLTGYAKTHDYPAERTSQLSAHLKFGTISIRQSYWAIRDTLGTMHPLLRQLYWRDFFTHVAYHSPFIFGSAFHEKYNRLSWKNDTKDFEAWCKGETGFPIVDAGMRQLNKTGWMHNRVRMIVASFLTKDLHIDWQWGEKYFAQQLVDYDPAVNNGNWQWVASTGCDAQPYFRIFNPWLQQKKFDNECAYIKKWIPELRAIDPKIIHTWFNPKHLAIKGYPRPIIDHAKESARAKILYKNV